MECRQDGYGRLVRTGCVSYVRLKVWRNLTIFTVKLTEDPPFGGLAGQRYIPATVMLDTCPWHIPGHVLVRELEANIVERVCDFTKHSDAPRLAIKTARCSLWSDEELHPNIVRVYCVERAISRIDRSTAKHDGPMVIDDEPEINHTYGI